MRLLPVRLCKQQPITRILSNTNTMPLTMPMNNMVPDRRLADGVFDVVGTSPSDEAG